MKIPMVEGVIGLENREENGAAYYAIKLPHSTYCLERALANAFAPSDQVVVIRKRDYDELVETLEYTKKCLGEEKPWLKK